MVLLQQLKKSDFWIKWCLFNFFIVAFVGVLMRYNILYSLPVLEHKYLLQSHSHFAFYGWVSAAIYTLVYYYFKRFNISTNFLKYEIIMLLNQVGAFGMLLSFLYGGYYWLSIIFSSLSFFAGVLYFIFIITDTKKCDNVALIWLKTGGFFAVFSAIGIFGLSYFTSRREEFEVLFRASTYFYLHFQYNGFFLFSCIGLFLLYLQTQEIYLSKKLNKIIITLLFIGAFFGYGLSTLWIKTPKLVLIFWFIIAFIQLYGAGLFIGFVKQKFKDFKFKNNSLQILFIVFSFAFLLKFLLPFLSLFPTLSTYVFYNLNIILAYLHLVLLVGFSVFLVWQLLVTFKPNFSLFLIFSIYLLVGSILLNEFFLIVLGLTALVTFSFSSAPFWLFFSALLILISIYFLIYSLKKTY